MRFEDFSINNYKCYPQVGPLKFEPGFNVIVGPNNAGKTALLESLSLQFHAHPHRSLSTRPRTTSPHSSRSHVAFSLTISTDELRDLLALGERLVLPVPKGYNQDSDGAANLLTYFDNQKEVSLALGREASAGSEGFYLARFPVLNAFKASGTTGKQPFFIYQRNEDSSFSFSSVKLMEPGNDQLLGLSSHLVNRVYAFRAERLTLGESSFGAGSVLRNDAQNLAEVLHTLQTTKPAKFNDFLLLTREIFPGIAHISVRPKQGAGNVQEIVMWHELDARDRADLAFTLAESGTGIGQVLAMLYVALNADFPLVIIIDEPNSFLHPAASRKLIQILKDFPQHQYLLSTHSPEIIRATSPSTLTLLERNGPVTSVRQVEASSLDSQRQCLQLLGVRLSDVFAADAVLWVEGSTEEEIFPMLMRDRDLVPSHAVISILAVRSASEFQGKRKRLELVLDIYRRLTSGASLVPRTLGFLFDSEGLTDADKRALADTSRGSIRFLPRRMFENYLLDSVAIAAVMNQLPTFASDPISSDTVEAWLTTNGRAPRFFDNRSVDHKVFSEAWERDVNAAHLLDVLYGELSVQRERYDKLRDGVALTKAILSNAPARFIQIEDLLREMVRVIA